MKTVIVLLMLIPAIPALNAQYNCGNLPSSGGTTSICYGYATARAFGYTGSSAVNYRPQTSWIPITYFRYSPGTNFKEGDILQWGPSSVDPQTGLSGANGHAVYVKQITSVPNQPDGFLQISASGVVTDEDPISQSDWDNIYVAEVNGEGAGETPSTLLSTVKGIEQTQWCLQRILEVKRRI